MVWWAIRPKNSAQELLLCVLFFRLVMCDVVRCDVHNGLGFHDICHLCFWFIILLHTNMLGQTQVRNGSETGQKQVRNGSETGQKQVRNGSETGQKQVRNSQIVVVSETGQKRVRNGSETGQKQVRNGSETGQKQVRNGSGSETSQKRVRNSQYE